MSKSIRQFLLICVALSLAAHRLPAPIILPDAEPTPEATPKKKKVSKTARTSAERTSTPVARAKAVSGDENSTVDAGGPAAGVPQPVTDQTAAAPQAPPLEPVAQGPGNMVRRTVVKSGTMEITYTLSATQPFDSRLTGQKIRLSIVESGTREIIFNGKPAQQPITTSTSTSINTGRTKSLVQLRDQMREVFRQFLNSATATNQFLGKVGDARYGGELHFIAEDADVLRFEYVPAPVTGKSSFRFKRADIQKFEELLMQ